MQGPVGWESPCCPCHIFPFQDWATVSGCYHAGTAPVPSIWKRNFRSALNRKPEFKVVEDNSSDATDPHKVYEILPVGVQAGEWG